MQPLSMEEMASIEGGFNWGCALGIAGDVLLVAGLSVVPGPGWAAAVYVTTAIVGPTVAGVGTGLACAS